MAVISALINNKISGFEQAFNVKDITSTEMKTAIKDCFDLYFGVVEKNEDNCQRIPTLVVNKLYKTVFSEYQVNADGDYAVELIEKLDKVKKKAMQMALVGGSVLIKPIIKADGFDFAVVRRDCFIPLGRNQDGELTSIGTSEQTIVNGKYYTLLEIRTAGEKLVIENRLFVSDSTNDLGVEVPLSTLDKYAMLQYRFEIAIKGIGLVEIKTPMFNDIDGSADGVPVYGPARGLIHNINKNEYQLNREFENGKSRIVASGDMFAKATTGERIIEDDVFVALDDDPETVGITIFSPALREQSYINRKNEYLRNVESLIGLKRGIISEVEAEQRTATEITSSQGDYNLTITDFQEVWQNALMETLLLCVELGKIYRVKGTTDINTEKVTVDWGDGVLYNRDKVWQEYKEMVQMGMIKPEIAIAWYFELPCKTKSDIEKIRQDYMPELEQLME
jgi:A118 family predicted phage portal protein